MSAAANHDSAAGQQAVMDFLADPATHGGAAVTRIDTHISAVFLAGERAYKLKKAVRLPFLDFTALDTRRVLCAAEVALNRRTAPQLYLGAEPVVRRPDGALAIGGEGAVIDWLVVMRRFADDARLDRVAAAGHGLDRALVRALADGIAAFHAAAAVEPGAGGAQAMRGVVTGNAEAFAPFLGSVFDPVQVGQSIALALAALDRHAALLDARRVAGQVRRCHGDLHLGNIALVDGRPLPFDALEFSDAFACIDVLYDLAFLIMDLGHAGYRREANQLLNAYLERRDEGEGVALLPVLLAMRAQIRAHVGAAVAVHAPDPAAAQAEARRYLAESLHLLAPRRPMLVAVGGLSGSGKSRCARELAPCLGDLPGALVVRSDVLRKRLAGVAAEDRLPPSAYAPEMGRQTYRALYDDCARALAAGLPVIADAVFARPEEREAIAAVAAAAGVPFAGLWLEAPQAVAEERILTRRGNASDATPQVLRAQMDYDLGPMAWTRIDSSGSKRQTDAAARAAVAALLPAVCGSGSESVLSF